MAFEPGAMSEKLGNQYGTGNRTQIHSLFGENVEKNISRKGRGERLLKARNVL